MSISNNAPSHLQDFVSYQNPAYFKKMSETEWRGQLVSSAGNTQFHIFYYGELLSDCIVGSDFSEALVVAQDIQTKETILLFDGCKHGYNAMFCDEFSAEQRMQRPTNQLYTSENHGNVFEVVVGVYRNIDYQEEKADFANADDMVELLNGQHISFNQLLQDGYDALFIDVYDTQAHKINIVSEELA